MLTLFHSFTGSVCAEQWQSCVSLLQIQNKVIWNVFLGVGGGARHEPRSWLCVITHTAELHNYLQQHTFTTLTSLALRVLKKIYTCVELVVSLSSL